MPLIGSEVAHFSRKYFFSGAVLAFAVMSAYQWAGFPYDNLCAFAENAPVFAAKTHSSVELLNGDTVSDVVVDEEEAFGFCLQHASRGYEGFFFPPLPGKQQEDKQWMSESQESLVSLYGITALVYLIGYIVLFFGTSIGNFLLSWFQGVYKPHGSLSGVCRQR